MTGGGEGFCVLKLPSASDGSLSGATERARRPAGALSGEEQTLAHLQWEVRRIEALLNVIRARLDQFEATGTQRAGTGRQCP